MNFCQICEPLACKSKSFNLNFEFIKLQIGTARTQRQQQAWTQIDGVVLKMKFQIVVKNLCDGVACC